MAYLRTFSWNHEQFQSAFTAVSSIFSLVGRCIDLGLKETTENSPRLDLSVYSPHFSSFALQNIVFAGSRAPTGLDERSVRRREEWFHYLSIEYRWWVNATPLLSMTYFQWQLEHSGAIIPWNKQLWRSMGMFDAYESSCFSKALKKLRWFQMEISKRRGLECMESEEYLWQTERFVNTNSQHR